MSDKKLKKSDTTDDKKLSKDGEDIKDETPPQAEYFEDTSFLRDEEELEFYNTPLIKKDHLLVILGTGVALILLCTFAVLNTISFADKIGSIKIYNNKVTDIGIYDPSLAYDTNKNMGWMAYSSIHQRVDDKDPNININLAYIQGKKGRWKYSQTVFSGKKDLLDGINGQILDIEGVWRYETPTLIYDPDDLEKTWKLYAYKYFWTGDTKEARRYSVITLKSTNNIASKEWSNEEWLFSARPGQPPEPYGSLVLLHLNNLHPSLKNMLYYAEPSAIYYNKSILMTLTAYKDDDKPESIILIGSKDHGQSWLFMGTLFTARDAKHYGSYTRVDSSALAEEDGKLYIMVSFGDEKVKHQGTHVFAFKDYIQAQLETDKLNYPTVIKYIPPPFPELMTIFGAGQSAYNENLEGGVYMPQMLSNNPSKPFAIYPTKQKLTEQ